MFQNIHLEKITGLLKYKSGDPLLFNTSLFLILFFLFLVIYNLFKNNKRARIISLIVFSFYFYYKSTEYFAAILIVSAVINFFFGKWIADTENFSLKRIFLALALILNLVLLGYFKYTNFILQAISDLRGTEFNPFQIFLPIGISFYTFKALTYIFDIYYDTLKPTKNFLDFVLYLSFFPNVLMGPIDRAADFLPQINKESFISKEDLGRATFLICSGLLKTVILSSYLEDNFIGRIFEFPLRYTGVEILIAIYAYAIRLYCDFSGYTDLAIGISLFLGFKIMDNFNSPFKATSIADFWRRWHISFSKWLLDYLFKPVQISLRRWKIFGNIIGLIVTFFICGLWHGAGWNFILWGLYFGVLMSIALFLQKPKAKLYNALRINNTKFLRFFQIIITFHFIAFSFLLFRLNDLQIAKDMLSQIFEFFHGKVALQFVEKMPLIFGLIVIGFISHFFPVKIEAVIKRSVTALPLAGKIILLALVIWLVAQFKSADIQPFIYFQF
ncbi:MAG: MBOAT family protein [Ignavibacteriales bacterium]|nr:MBOAT family protein [Ignavibacteriales bacterium]